MDHIQETIQQKSTYFIHRKLKYLPYDKMSPYLCEILTASLISFPSPLFNAQINAGSLLKNVDQQKEKKITLNSTQTINLEFILHFSAHQNNGLILSIPPP